MDESSIPSNRLERWASVLRRNRLASSLALLALIAIAESGIAASYVAKRVAYDQPFIDLLEQYYVLSPLRHLFPDQYIFPPQWRHLYVGDLENPRGPARWWIGDALLGHRTAPSTVVTENRWSYRRTNAQGFIVSDEAGTPYQDIPPEDVFRIVVLGGSTVEGNGSSGSLEALPAHLKRVLEAKYVPALGGKRRFEVINAGIGGFYSANEFLYYASELIHYQPQLVISYNGWNDLQIQNRLLLRYGARAPLLIDEDTSRNTNIINGYFRWGSSAGNLLRRTAAGALSLARGVALLDIPIRYVMKLIAVSSASPPKVPYSPLSARRYAGNIELLTLATRRDGVHHAWFLQPLVGLGNHPPSAFREQAYLASPHNNVELLGLFYDDARGLQKKLKKRYVSDGSTMLCAADLTDVFDDDPATVYNDPGHLNNEGNRIVAQRIAGELDACGLIKPRDE